MKRFKSLIFVSFVLAAALLALPLLTACGPEEANRTPNTEVKNFASISEYRNYVDSYYVNSYNQKNNWWRGLFTATDDMAAAPEAAEDAQSDGEAGGDSGTNTQVQGVDESDIVKVYGGNIFTLRYRYADASASIAIFSSASGKTIEVPCKDYYPSEFYVTGGRLVVFGTYYEPREDWGRYSPKVGIDMDCLWDIGSFTVRIYDVSNLDFDDADSVALTRSIKVPNSYYQTSREIDGTVYMALTSYKLFRRSGKAYVPEYYDSNSGTKAITAAPEDLYLTPHGGSFGVMYLLSFKIDDAESSAKFSAYLGASSNFYADADTFYSAASIYLYNPVPVEGGVTDAVTNDDEAVSSKDEVEWWNRYQTFVMRFDISSGKFVFDSCTAVHGFIKDQFSMDEFDDSFRIVATRYDKNYTQSTYLYVFGIEPGKLTLLGVSEAMGVGEQVYSVRFNGTACRVVTAVQIDPLYVVDISDKTKPTVTAELKSEGVNDYMHNLGDKLILGLGRAGTDFGGFSGFKASIYYDGETLKELLTYTDSQSYSDLSYNHKALLAYPLGGDNHLFAVPLSGYYYTYSKNSYTFTSRLVVMKVSENPDDYDLESAAIGALPVTSLAYSVDTSDGWYYIDGVRRAVVANGSLYAVGNSKIIRYNLQTLEVEQVFKLD